MLKLLSTKIKKLLFTTNFCSLIKKNKNAFSLLEVLLASGVISVIALGTVTLMENSNKSNKANVEMNSALQYVQSVDQLLSNTNTCTRNFGPPGQNLTPSTTIRTANIVDASGTVILKADSATTYSMYGDNSWVLTGYTITSGTVITTVPYTQTLQLSLFLRKSNPSKSTGVPNVTRTLNLRAQLTAAGGSIVTCNSIGTATATATYWSSTNNTDIFNTNSGNVSITGNVGIGTAAPGKLLTVNAGAAPSQGIQILGSFAPSLDINNGGANFIRVAGATAAGINSDVATANDGVLRSEIGDLILAARNSAGAIHFTTGSPDSTKMYISNAGDVGIGTNAPATKLEVATNANSVSDFRLSNTNAGSGAYTNLQLGNNMNGNRGGLGVFGSNYTPTPGPIPSTNFPMNGGYRRDGTYLYSNGTGGISIFSENVAGTAFVSIGTSNRERLRITNSGTVIVSGDAIISGDVLAPAFVYTSDERLKNKGDKLDGLKMIEQLNGYNFTWKKDGKADIGVMAQEVEKVLPLLVHTGMTGTKSVDYARLVAPLIEAVKTQQSEIEQLKEEVRLLSEEVRKK